MVIVSVFETVSVPVIIACARVRLPPFSVTVAAGATDRSPIVAALRITGKRPPEGAEGMMTSVGTAGTAPTFQLPLVCQLSSTFPVQVHSTFSRLNVTEFAPGALAVTGKDP